MWPTELSNTERFKQMTALTQRLFLYLWLHPDLNSGGFIAHQPEVWANAAPDLEVDSINASVDEMTRQGVAGVDRSTGELLVRGFIQYDSSKKPNVYVNAMRAVQTARSPRLRQVGWDDVRRIHPPPLERREFDDPEKQAKAELGHQKIKRERDAAYEELRAHVEGTVWEPSENGSGTVREPTSVSGPGVASESGHPQQHANNSRSDCTGCGRYPDAGHPGLPGLCAVCITRERNKSEWS
jgi:hypothetical protein